MENLVQGFRKRRFWRILQLIEGVLKKKGECRVIDIGGTEQYWADYEEQLKGLPLRITLVNLFSHDVIDASRFESKAADATDLSQFDDGSFDMVHSNSVIEHVGGWQSMVKMARNVQRLAPVYYVQTPNFWFPVEPHFRSVGFHWLPEQLRYRRLLRKRFHFQPQKCETLSQAMETVEDAKLLDMGQMRELFPDATMHRERLWPLTKSIIATRTEE